MIQAQQHSMPPVPGDVFAGTHRVSKAWPGLTAEYAWLPPFCGAAPTRPNRLEVVFSAHRSVALEQDRSIYDVQVDPGGFYVVGAKPTTLLRVDEYSDTLEMYPDIGLLMSAAELENIRNFELEPTLEGGRPAAFSRDPVTLGIAHLLRRACMDTMTLTDIGASEAAHALAARVLQNQHVMPLRARPTAKLGDRSLRIVADHIEDRLEQCITIGDLARLAGVSPFHFARCFKRTTGLAPHQYVLARRVDLAKRKLTSTSLSVQSIAWSVGFENVNHFRRQFSSQFGVTPGKLRRAIRM